MGGVNDPGEGMGGVDERTVGVTDLLGVDLVGVLAIGDGVKENSWRLP